MRLINYYEKCSCGKEILVQILVSGSNHNLSVKPVCKECVKLTDEYKKEHPELAKEIENWKAT